MTKNIVLKIVQKNNNNSIETKLYPVPNRATALLIQDNFENENKIALGIESVEIVEIANEEDYLKLY